MHSGDTRVLILVVMEKIPTYHGNRAYVDA
jgi:hypothetical protein